jgi:hypothetical protein
VSVKNVFKFSDVVSIIAPADFIPVIEKTLADKILSIEQEKIVHAIDPINETPKRKGGKKDLGLGR